MADFICPVCKEKLINGEKNYICKNGHNFDKSKFGYVNLLMSNTSSAKRHGDDRLMVRARRDFLSKGYYSFLLNEITDICKNNLNENPVILDAGCGECYYSRGVNEALPKAQMLGVDISKDALRFASKGGALFSLAVASLFDMPVMDDYCDCVINCFSPKAEEEFKRVLKKGGILIRIVPLEDHLLSLKAAIYKEAYLNEKPGKDIENLTLIDYREISKELNICTQEDVQNLFKMTPYYYKTGREDQEKLNGIKSFKTKAAFGIFIYRKENQYA